MATTEAPSAAREQRRAEDALLSVRDLRTHFDVRGSFVDRLLGRQAGFVKAVNGVSFELRRGEVLGLVGESGSGKTTLGRSLLGLVPATSGEILFRGRDLTKLGAGELREVRKDVQMVFQDPHASLNPAMTIGQAVAHPLRIHGMSDSSAAMRRSVSLVLERVGLVPVDQFVDKYPSDLSGGQKQRAVIARAIIVAPSLVVADEPVSMLDMSVRAKILELMLSLKDDLDLTYLYITHDLATAKFFCDRIAIMYLGQIVEIGPSEAIYRDPKHPYTQALLKAIPEPDPQKTVPRDLPRGEVPDAVTPPLGCPFHPRCPHAFELCGWESRDLADLLEARWTRVSEGELERERDAVGDLKALETPSTIARLGTEGRAGEAAEVMRKLRGDDLEEPLWKGVRAVRENGRVEVEFEDPVDPRLLPADEVEVACHLYDDEVREQARRAAEQAGREPSPESRRA